MLSLLEFRSKSKSLADLLNYAAVIEDGIVLGKDGSLLAGWSFRGPDLGSSTPDELESISARVNAALKFGSGWMINCDAMRIGAPGYPEKSAFPDRTTKIIDVERRQQFLAVGAHYESLYGITLTYMPPLRVEGKLTNMMFERDGGSVADAVGERVLQQFRDAIVEFEAQLSTMFHVERLQGHPDRKSVV